MCCNNCSVAGKRQSQRFVETVHRVSREHTRTATAGRQAERSTFSTCSSLIESSAASIMASIKSSARPSRLPASIASGYKNRRNIQTHSSHQHTRVILSQLLIQTIASALCAFTIYSTLSAMISRERIKHPIVPHSDTVVDSDRIKFSGKATELSISAFTCCPISCRCTWLVQTG